jgi:single-strand DNA-binding protein
MASYNRVILLGNLVRDIELRYTQGRMAICENAIAINERRKNAAGDWIDETSYVDVTFFGRTAEVVSEYLSKGSPIFIEGRLKQDRWEKDGQKRSKLHVIVDRMQLIGSKGEGKGAAGGSTARPTSSASSRFAEQDSHPGMQVSEMADDAFIEEDMPF